MTHIPPSPGTLKGTAAQFTQERKHCYSQEKQNVKQSYKYKPNLDWEPAAQGATCPSFSFAHPPEQEVIKRC